MQREFTNIIIKADYIPQEAKAKLALEKQHDSASKQLKEHPDSVVIAARDFNHVHFKLIMPKFHRNV